MAEIIRNGETITMKNNQAWKTPDFIENNDTLIGFNFSQKQPDTDIFAGLTGVVLQKCNLTNCLTSSVEVSDCNLAKISFCYWLNPDMDLPVEPEDCPHVIDTVEIDDIIVEYYRENGVL